MFASLALYLFTGEIFITSPRYQPLMMPSRVSHTAVNIWIAHKGITDFVFGNLRMMLWILYYVTYLIAVL